MPTIDRHAMENGAGNLSRPVRMERGNITTTTTTTTTNIAQLDHSRQQSHSRQQPHSDVEGVGECALHHLFTAFVGKADTKIDQCVGLPHQQEQIVEPICAPGVDPDFDRYIYALGHIARETPKPLLDVVMLWRKIKSDYAGQLRDQVNKSRVNGPVNGLATRRNVGHEHVVSDPGNPGASEHPNGLATSNSQMEDLMLADRRSTISIYMLVRVLMEVFKQSTLERVTPEMADRLEEIIFAQLKAADIDQLMASPSRMANWKSYGEIFGVMSEMNFRSVADRFFREIERLQMEYSIRGNANKDAVESKMELVITGMRHIRIKTSPEDAFERSCAFMQRLGISFEASHGQRIKHAYCRILERLLLPVAAKGGPELNRPRWRAVVDTINKKVVQMLFKPRHWLEISPLMIALNCVSSTDFFAHGWMQIVSSMQPKLKDRTTRPSALQGITRLVWTYVYRICEPSNVAVRKLEEVVKIMLPTGKRSSLSTEPMIAEPLIQFIRIIGFKHQEFCFKNIIFPLISSELVTSGKDLRVEQLEPEKMVIGIRAFLAIMTDLEYGRPPFPQDFEHGQSMDRMAMSSLTIGSLILTEPLSTPPREERLSWPVQTAKLGDSAREYYVKFCQILGRVTMICDQAFGGQAVLDEKFGTQTPKTPIAESFSFGRRDEHPSVSDHRRGFYDLLHVAVQALPRCLSKDIPFNSLVNLLCTGTAHVQNNIAASSAQSLRSIARQSHAQPVTIGFARFILNFDDRYSTMSDGGMLGPGHIETTLQLYIELLRIWIQEIRNKSGLRAIQLDLSAISNQVNEIEAHGLFFLCSQSRRVRSFAITVLRLITEFDTALGNDNVMRIIHILERDSSTVLDFNDENLSVAERSRLQRGMRQGNPQNALIELCGSDVSYDSTLWFKIFPNLVRITFDRCPVATNLAREIVCARLLQMHRAIKGLAELPKNSQYPGLDLGGTRSTPRATNTPPDVLIEQWKLYLIFACTALTNTASQQPALQDFQHARQQSRPSPRGPEKIASARSLFQFVIPLLEVSAAPIRDSVVTALGSINVTLYRTLLEGLHSVVAMCNDDSRARLHQRTASSPGRNHRTDILRTEIAHVYKLTSHFLRQEAVYTDDAILDNLVAYTNGLKLFLSDADVQSDWDFQKLRRHYCGLMEELYEGINRTRDPTRWMPFEARKSAFALMEDWCGCSPDQSQARQRQDSVQHSIDQQREYGDNVTAAMEIEKRNLRFAALSSMAALCGGPMSVTTERNLNLQFDRRRMLLWIETIFSNPSDKMHGIGRRALKNLILHNRAHPALLDRAIQMCYLADAPKALESYFGVVSEVLLENADYPLAFSRILGAALFTLGNENRQLRSKSAQLLRTLEERLQKSSKIQDYDIGIADKTTAVYKLAQFEISKRLAKQHSDLAFVIFSEFTLYFKMFSTSKQRNMVAVILPWVQTVELQVDPNGGPTAQSYMLLANLFEITIHSGAVLHNEVQALWQAVATGPHGGNVQLVLDFIISLCLERREQNFVDFAKQIVVFLSSTPAGQKVIDFLLLQINPKAMVQEKREPAPMPPDALSLPYVADLSSALPVGNKQAGFSLGQLCLILLVDLMVSPVQLAAEHLPVLLQVVFVLWDHFIPLVQDQAREMLVHLIHELVISKIDEQWTTATTKVVEGVIDAVRRHDSGVVWAYDDNANPGQMSETKVPKSMERLAADVVDVFWLAYPGIREQWGKTTLSWATSCPVRHLACRSFQIFRCILTSLDQSMLADMLARLSNTIADDESDYKTFSMEILTTLKTIIGALSPADLLQYPQLFWATCACLNTIHESEFIESLAMLESFIGKVDLNRPEVVQLLAENIPSKWEGKFEGIQPLIYQGLRSSLCMSRTLTILNKLTWIPSNWLVGDDSRLLFTLLANLPGMLLAMEDNSKDPEPRLRASRLAKVAETQGRTLIAQSLISYVDPGYQSQNDILYTTMAAIRDTYLPEWDFQCLAFIMAMLTNRLGWVKTKAMRMLCVLIPIVNKHKPEFTSGGTDLIAPLLRLLRTEFCPQALEVLDHVMTMPGIYMDKHHLRMSMAGSQSRSIRKEYERTPSLYGIPDESGWSIPMPAICSASTRNNVHAVFYTCAGIEPNKVTTAAKQDQEFHPDSNHHNYAYQDRTSTMVSDDVRTDGNMGDLVMKLNSLDDFFDDKVVSSPTHETSFNSLTPFPPTDPGDAGARYDQQTLPLLRQSLTRTASISSLQNGFTDTRIAAFRDPGVMSPTAFAVPPASTARPYMIARTMTTPQPSTFASATGFELLSVSDDDLDEAFSDEETKTPVNPTISGPSVSIGSRLRSGTRSGMRRLTGGNGRDRDRELASAMDRRGIPPPLPLKSPKVPKIPAAYLMHTPPTPNGH
ncbi:MAG: Cell morphogenesis protein PAG1 [Peltula sp. TS41687]|nr:MAG: Cell morphogenesis protein PAG1 [Peltula sp. TS41687]